MLRLIAAGVGLAAVAVTEAGIDAQRDLPARGAAAKLLDHVRRAAIDVDLRSTQRSRASAIKDVGRIDDRRRRARGGVAGGQGAANLAGADRVDQRAVTPQEVQDGQIRARLLGIATWSKAARSCNRSRIMAAS